VSGVAFVTVVVLVGCLVRVVADGVQVLADRLGGWRLDRAEAKFHAAMERARLDVAA
jgi:hypothetical protein